MTQGYRRSTTVAEDEWVIWCHLCRSRCRSKSARFISRWWSTHIELPTHTAAVQAYEKSTGEPTPEDRLLAAIFGEELPTAEETRLRDARAAAKAARNKVLCSVCGNQVSLSMGRISERVKTPSGGFDHARCWKGRP